MPVSLLPQQTAIMDALCRLVTQAWQPEKIHLDTPETQDVQKAQRIAFVYLAEVEPSEECAINEERADLVFEIVLRFPKPSAEKLHLAKRREAEALRGWLTTGKRIVAGGIAYNRTWRGETYIASDGESRQAEAQSAHASVAVRFVVEGVQSDAS